MDIKRMHEMIEKLSEAAECEFSKGIENVDTCEMDKVVDMMKDLSEAMYYRTLTKAMQESDTEEIMEMFDKYGDDDKRYYKQYDRKVNRHDDFALSAELFGSLAFCLYAGLGFAQSHRLENFDFRSCGVAVFDSAAADVIRVKTIP